MKNPDALATTKQYLAAIRVLRAVRDCYHLNSREWGTLVEAERLLLCEMREDGITNALDLIDNL